MILIDGLFMAFFVFAATFLKPLMFGGHILEQVFISYVGSAALGACARLHIFVSGRGTRM